MLFRSADMGSGRPRSVKPIDPAMYYTTEKVADGKIRVVIHNTPLKDKTSVKPGAIVDVEVVIDVPRDKKAMVLAGEGDDENQPVQIWFTNGNITAIKWNERKVPPRN